MVIVGLYFSRQDFKLRARKFVLAFTSIGMMDPFILMPIAPLCVNYVTMFTFCPHKNAASAQNANAPVEINCKNRHNNFNQGEDFLIIFLKKSQIKPMSLILI